MRSQRHTSNAAGVVEAVAVPNARGIGRVVTVRAATAGRGVQGRNVMANQKIQNRALSVRQPYAEQIMRGTKKTEYRSKPTNIRGRIFIYASKMPGHKSVFEKMKSKPGDFPVGVLIGTVEIVDCNGEPFDYEWRLAKPKRLKKLIKPDGHPQPVWFKPFNEGKKLVI